MTTNPTPLARLAEVSPPSRPEVEVDNLDLALLRALATDARQSQRALARQIDMSPPTVADRLSRLERSGVIRGYRTDIDWAALGLPVVVYLAVTASAGMDLSEIIREIREMPEAETMSVVTGSLDLLVRLRVRDHTHLRHLLLDKVFQISGVQRTETFLSLADVEPDNFIATLLEDMIKQRSASPGRLAHGRLPSSTTEDRR
ncbi:MAG TPA: Lrp/AsnC family transcriptional regulator [Streptosporangiaceae bacterium]|nr:Lrp/AsnC family transcriptional regulator [Streptosporangiaceae bacterium]